jgi:hypothetical protein
VRFFCAWFRGDITPGDSENLFDEVNFGRGQPDLRTSSLSPRARRWFEYFWLSSHARLLLLDRQLHHAPRGVWPAQSGEYLATHSEVGMALVLLLDRFR